jgi:hypothetical protein
MRVRTSLLVWVVASAAGCSTSATLPSSGGPDGGTDDPSREPILDGGGDVPASPHGEDLCPPGACNYQTGAGCGSPTPSCAPLLDGKGGVAPTCESAGTTPYGGACGQWTDCQPGAVCAGGKCLKLCCGKDWTGCTANEHCLSPFWVRVGDAGVVSSRAFLCIPVNQCDALRPASCTEPGTTCQLADGTGATACLPEGTSSPPEACTPPLVCKGGSTCVNNGCRRLCKAVAGGGEPSCPLEEGRCVHFNRDPAGVGECSPN